ncbi:hypothetical protein B0H14DRAFT_2981816 [Mycena olivaceomarginata]|nr:hypothetical protein B0H14DRAFT_2981816 [Mycena olivaceomarginata]
MPRPYMSSRSLPLHHSLAKPSTVRDFFCNPLRCTTILLTVTLSLTTIVLLTDHPHTFALAPYLFVPAPPTDIELMELPRPRPVIVDGTVYDAFTALSPAQALADPRVRPIRAHAAIPMACLDRWVASGLWTEPCLHGMVHEAQIDLVYVWVNGSCVSFPAAYLHPSSNQTHLHITGRDPLHANSRRALLEATGYATKEARFREHDELRYSLRAARRATRLWLNSTWHVVTADMADPSPELRSTESTIARWPIAGCGSDAASRHCRLGLVPQWLDIECGFNISAQGQPPIMLHHDTQLFHLTGDPRSELQADDAAQWLAQVVPNFNSHAVESQLANLSPDIVADNIVALNDDQFLMLLTPPSAFHTTLYGPVFRMDPYLLVDGGGEWRSIPWSAHLLDERFGTRRRPYIKHNARALSLPLLHEAALAFGEAFAATPLSRFRGEHFAPREWEVNTIFLATHFVIERHREALLWSWVVGKWGSQARMSGMLDEKTKVAMWAELGGRDGKSEINLRMATRKTMQDIEPNLKRAEIKPPRAPKSLLEADTVYSWVSMNGYSPTWHNLASHISISRDKCLGANDERAWDMFRRLVMDDISCGDQVISALMHASKSGLGVFLPPHSVPPPPPSLADPIILPLVLPVAPTPFPANPRAFVVRLIQRYSYAIGESAMYFVGPQSAQAASRLLRDADRQRNIALMCINDDLGDDEVEVRAADEVMRQWFEERWPEKLECER